MYAKENSPHKIDIPVRFCQEKGTWTGSKKRSGPKVTMNQEGT
eukprot:UN01215